jgi:hypothetical protein
MTTITKQTFDRLLRGKRRIPHWHGNCSLDHRSAEEAAKCQRAN